MKVYAYIKKHKSYDTFFKHHYVVNEVNGCWEWKGPMVAGYGRIRVGLNDSGHSRNCAAHRVAWMYAYGDIAEGQNVCHHCDNRKCVNPEHLFLGDHGDNHHDRSMKKVSADSSKHYAIERILMDGGTLQSALKETKCSYPSFTKYLEFKYGTNRYKQVFGRKFEVRKTNPKVEMNPWMVESMLSLVRRGWHLQ